MKRTAYAFAVLRYSPDVVAGEFLNVGVAVMSASGVALFKVTSSLMRLAFAFPGCDLAQVKKQLTRLEIGLKKAVGLGYSSLPQVLETVSPDSQGSFHWSDVGAGVSVDLSDTLKEIFERFVTARDDGKYGEVEDLVTSYYSKVDEHLQPHWLPLPASNDEYADARIAVGSC